jgi:hypothetical protein
MPNSHRPTLEGLEQRSLQAGSFMASIPMAELRGMMMSAQTTATVGFASTTTLNGRFVDRVYRDLLGRTVDPTGLAFWTGMLSQGASREQVVMGIENSPEFRTDVVESLFMRFLGRPADLTGLNTFTTFLANGGAIEQVEESLTSSPEFFLRRGNGTNDGFVNALFQDALNRPVDPVGRATFDRALASGATRAQVATAVFTSLEFRQDLVEGFFERFLNRVADGSGLNTFTALLQQRVRDEQVIADIVGSAEFFAQL